MTVVPEERVTLERHLMTLRAMKLLGARFYHSPRQVVAVLELAALDGLWPVPGPGARGYFRRTSPYYGGTRQHMEQMSWKKTAWLEQAEQNGRKNGLFTIAKGAPFVAALPERYRRAATEFDHERPEADNEPDETAKRCVVCRRHFRSRNWTCGDPVCGELLELPAALMTRRSGLESEGLVAVFDVELRSQMRFVQITTDRGFWRTNALKWETWEQLLERAVG